MPSDHLKKKVRTNLGKVLVDPDFFLFRPLQHYRTNANIILLRTDPMVFIDTGTKNNPPIAHIEQVLKNHRVDPEKIGYIVLTHAHQDHFQNLPDLQKIAPYAKTICHKNDLRTIRYPFLMDPTWFEGLYYNGLTKWGVYSYSAFYAVFSNFYFKTIQKVNKIEAYVKNEAVIRVGQEKIHIIPVQGHSQGHLCVLDGRKNLFLGDFVPFTPWVDPTERGIDLIVASIKRVLEFSTAQEIGRASCRERV